MTATIPETDAERFAQRWREWHTRHEGPDRRPARLPGRHRHPLAHRHAQRFPDAPGAWTTDEAGVHVVLDGGERIVVDGRAAGGRHDFGVVPERASLSAGWTGGGRTS